MEQKINSITADELLSSAPTCHKPMLSDAVFRPMLFSTVMVRALLNGRKTQTRRIVKDVLLQIYKDTDDVDFLKVSMLDSQKPKIGEIIWVRETLTSDGFQWNYKSDDSVVNCNYWGIFTNPKNTIPSLFMPKSVCRLFLKITNIRLERLQDITEQDAINEGIDTNFEKGCEYYKEGDYKNYTWHGEGGNDSFSGFSNVKNAKESFQSLWYKIKGKKSWNDNPFVWVYDFEVSLDCPHGFR